jgi:two-component system sensor histidine kinase DevS
VQEISAPSFGQAILRAEDILDELDELDVLASTEAMQAFFARQGWIRKVMSATLVDMRGTKPDGTPFVTEVSVAKSRPPGDLPSVFWVQIVVGLAGVWLGGWVLSLRPRDPAAWFLVLAGVGLMVSSHAAALCSTC